MAELLTLGGRLYAPAEAAVTYKQSAYIKGVIASARELVSGGDEVDIVGALYSSGLVTDIIAGLITPVGETWSLATAKTLARELEEITNPDDHAVMDAVVAVLVQSFLGVKRPSSETSPTSSEMADAAPAKPARKRARPAAGSGATSSPALPTTAESPPAP